MSVPSPPLQGMVWEARTGPASLDLYLLPFPHTVSLRGGLARTNGTHPLLCQAYVPVPGLRLSQERKSPCLFVPADFFNPPRRHISIFKIKHSPFIKPYNRLGDLTGLFCCEVKSNVYSSSPGLSVSTVKSSSCRVYFRVSLAFISINHFLLQ